MEQRTLARWLKVILIGIGVCGVILYGWLLPMIGKDIVADYPEFSNRYWPWLAFLWATGLPCCAVLVLGWKIADSIGRDRSFTMSNARRLTWISRLAAGDTVFFFAGNATLVLLNMHHPGVFLALMSVVFAGAAAAVAAACLSHLVQKAAALQEQSDLTI